MLLLEASCFGPVPCCSCLSRQPGSHQSQSTLQPTAEVDQPTAEVKEPTAVVEEPTAGVVMEPISRQSIVHST